MKNTPNTISKIALSICFLLLTGNIAAQEKVEWLSWSEASELAQTEASPKKMFIDVYTDWCGWCKKMDKDTFQNAEVAEYMKANFYMVKMDGEGKEPLTYKEQTFNFKPSGRRGYHEFAAALMNGRMSYPTVVFLDEKLDMLSPVPGYQKPVPFMKIAKYFGDNIYLEKDWKTYDAEGK